MATNYLRVTNMVWAKQKHKQIMEIKIKDIINIEEETKNKGKIYSPISQEKHQQEDMQHREVPLLEKADNNISQSTEGSSNNSTKHPLTDDTACVQAKGGQLVIDLGCLDFLPHDHPKKLGPDLDQN